VNEKGRQEASEPAVLKEKQKTALYLSVEDQKYTRIGWDNRTLDKGM